MITSRILNLVSGGFKAGSDQTWLLVVGILIILTLLLFSNMLRRAVPFLRKSLLPVAFIGGAIGLVFKIGFEAIELNVTGAAMLTQGFTGMVQVLTYHGLAIGFIALALKVMEEGRAKSKEMARDSLKAGLIIIGGYLIQGIFGLGITMLGHLVFPTSVHSYAGILMPMAWGQGPGQAMNIGSLFEQEGHFLGGLEFGVSLSSMGIFAAALGGVIYLNYAAKKGLVKRRSDEDDPLEISELIDKNGEVPLSESIDKLTIQSALIAVTYLITWGLIKGIDILANISNVPFLSNSIVPLLYGFNFIFATIIALVVKKIIATFQKKKIIKKQYINNFYLDRITGLAFDVMIISSIMSIDIKKLADTGLIITLLVMCVLGFFLTYFYTLYMVRRAFPNYKHEGFVIFYGNLAGTASDGIALLREIDPGFKTPAADALVYGSTVAIGLGFPLLLITGFIYDGGPGFDGWQLWVSLGVMIVYFIGLTLIFEALTGRFKKKPTP